MSPTVENFSSVIDDNHCIRLGNKEKCIFCNYLIQSNLFIYNIWFEHPIYLKTSIIYIEGKSVKKTLQY